MLDVAGGSQTSALTSRLVELRAATPDSVSSVALVPESVEELDDLNVVKKHLPRRLVKLCESSREPGSTPEARQDAFVGLRSLWVTIPDALRLCGSNNYELYELWRQDADFVEREKRADADVDQWLLGKTRLRIEAGSDVMNIVGLKMRGLFAEPKPGVTVNVANISGGRPEDQLTPDQLRELIPLLEADEARRSGNVVEGERAQ